MRTLLVFAVLLGGCDKSCGDASFVTSGTALALWDADGDGRTADLMEECGAIAGSFGLRRHDLGLTTLLFDPTVRSANFAESLTLSDYLLPAGSITFYTAHLQEGAVIGRDQISGYGLSKLSGTSGALYDTYGLLDAQVTVLKGPKVLGGLVNEMNGTERWRLQWEVSFGDAQSGIPLQVWSAEDDVDISDGVEIGDETYPPDWDGPHLPPT